MQVQTRQWVTVDLYPAEQKKVALFYLYEAFKWGDCFFIAPQGEGMGAKLGVYEDREFHTSHAWTAKVFIRDASGEDVAIEQVIKKIKSGG